ncbi:cupin domain-containing protein [Desulfotalea psychrophila]|uniref:Related to ethanolamine utilization protein (EutQ) n=1 Tax=Desulfotalea psychrophila (strain LSv54 / DSM 12343) TaxID=177439 RepID=Q6AIR5_DESPS|nr:ethanolamine utilization protein EutQ [Desulfotalea psychrophila]CAG37765.1 related to ethanolamine utilization protein (EutQ) [Desulfotalea psychrophila LSv54]
MGKRIITEADINGALKSGKKSILCPPQECIITPQAVDKALELGLKILQVEEKKVVVEACPLTSTPAPAAPVAPAAPAVPVKPAAPVAPVAFAAPAIVTPTAPVNTSGEADVLISEVCEILKKRLPGVLTDEALESLVRRVVTERLAQPDVSVSLVAENASSSCGGICVVEGDRLLKANAGAPVAVAEQVFIADALGECAGAQLAGGYMEWEKASFKRTVECPEVGVVVAGELHLDICGKTLVAKVGDMVYFPEGVDVTYSTPTSVRIACINNVA